ncbi:bZIP transcription factor 39-like [Phragmites australis]|uniref:bZIP transcription factor 39-like n=1 Tax=Phragmites australis TaxID=29695 RepID=UPI002D78A505|nr:bZIP transcription factor 39-like [Phragmites australis]
MAEPALLGTSPFDLRHYPAHLFDPDLPLAGGLPLCEFDGDGLDFDLPVDFSVDDFLLRSPDRVDDESGEGSAAGSDPTASSPASPTTSAANSAVANGDRELKHEDSDEGRSGGAPNWSLKRKQASPGANSDGAKCRRSGYGELSQIASASASASRAAAEDSNDRGAVGEEEDKRHAARLVRNRESAQLSRQRKKRYVEELEQKVKSMHSAINDLNCKISFVMAENATLRQQLGSGGGNCPPPGVVYPPALLPGMHFPWVPGYAPRPHGSHVPLVPIPRLKPQQTAATAKLSKKPETKKAVENKSKTRTKKVVSVSLLGLLFVALVFGAFVPGFNHSFGMRGRSDNAMFRNFGHSDARVFSVTNHGKGPKGGLNSSEMINSDPGMMTGNTDGARQKHRPAHNSSESLPALLYVPRNGKHVKIIGNLIIHSVLASEKAVAHRASKGNVDQSGKDHKETSVAISRYLSLPGKDVHPQETSPADGPLPQWFREGMAGPILNSGMCSEVFQFDISAAGNSGGIIPASPTVNSSSVNATQKIPTPAPAYGGKLKNRRIMYNEAIPLTGKMVDNTKPFNRTSESSKLPNSKAASSIVSVLADPREAGNGDGDPRISPKPLSRIFVVVLLDGVRYVTYSCTLPFKSASPHLVN